MFEFKIKESIKFTLILCGIGFLISNNVVMYLTFLSAYFSPTKTTVVHVNMFNEALVEFFVVPFSIGFGIVCIVQYFRSPFKIKLGFKSKENVL